MEDRLMKIMKAVKDSSFLVHCIVGAVSSNFCANGLLSIGARPVMAQYPKDVRDFTPCADALFVSLAGITGESLRAIKTAMRCAKRKNIPIVFDAVGVSGSRFRRTTAVRLIRRYSPDVIKGNYAEICALYDKAVTSSGVDSDNSIKMEKTEQATKALSVAYNAIILASGKTDIVCDTERCFFVEGGVPALSAVTGTGCLLGALSAATLSAERSVYAVILACVLLSDAGERADSKGFSSGLIEELGRWDGRFNVREEQE